MEIITVCTNIIKRLAHITLDWFYLSAAQKCKQCAPNANANNPLLAVFYAWHYRLISIPFDCRAPHPGQSLKASILCAHTTNTGCSVVKITHTHKKTVLFCLRSERTIYYPGKMPPKHKHRRVDTSVNTHPAHTNTHTKWKHSKCKQTSLKWSGSHSAREPILCRPNLIIEINFGCIFGTSDHQMFGYVCLVFVVCIIGKHTQSSYNRML